MRGLARRLHRPGEPVRKYLATAGRVIARQGLKHHVVAALRVGRSIPRAVEGDEHAVAIVAREIAACRRAPCRSAPNAPETPRSGAILVGARLRRSCRRRRRIPGASTSLRWNAVVVALRPAVIAALFQVQQLFGRQRGLLLGLVQFRPIRVQLVASVLRDEDVVVRHRSPKPSRIAYPGREALGRRERLVGLVRVIAPDAAARLELRARIDARATSAMRFCGWQALVAVATSMYRDPSASIANGCMG